MEKLLSILLITIILFSCDIIEQPYRELGGIDTSKGTTKVLLEEYTGFRCGNCPEATEIAHNLKEKYTGRVIVLSIHAGGYAKPTIAHPYDFRTTIGDELDAFFGMSSAGNPCGMVNRIGFPTKSHILREAQWESAIQSALAIENRIDLRLITSFNSANNQIFVSVEIKYLKAGTSNHHLCIYIAEDSIVSYQRDDRLTPPDVENYVHNNVLRAGITPTWGVPLNQNDIPAGTTFSKEFTYVIPQNKDWKPSKLKIIAFIHDNSNSFEILQVTEKKLIE
ncbi:MAG: Omp28 family outer membrane lipoprotein [Candidatus Kapaibacteriales bacterium]